jgi:hypothetical protein
MMNEKSENTFDCYDCSIQYDTSKYGFKYTNKHLRRKNYPRYIKRSDLD